MKRRVLFVLPLVLLAGCGGGAEKHAPRVVETPHHVNPSIKPPPCGQAPSATDPAVHRMGECIAKRFGRKHAALTRGEAHALGVDLSIWDGEPNFEQLAHGGVRFAWNQSNDGGIRDSNYAVNCQRGIAHGIACGTYIFVEAGRANYQADIAAEAIRAAGGYPQQRVAVALDVEVPGSYSNVCPMAERLRRELGTSRIMVYTAPGISEVHSACGTKLWPAEWSASAPYPFGPWAASDVLAQQTCGGCHIAGIVGEADLDRDYGVLNSQPNPELLAKKRRLYALYRLRSRERHVLTVRQCRTGDHRHAQPRNTPAQAQKSRRECNAILKAGDRHNAEIRQLHAEGV